MRLGKGLRRLLSFYPSSGPLALLQSPGPSPGPFINRRNVRLPPAQAPLQPLTPGALFAGEKYHFVRVAEAASARGSVEGGGHGVDGAGPRGPRAATAAVRALLVRGSSKLCKSLGRGRSAFSRSPHLFLHQPSQAPDQVSWGRKTFAFSQRTRGKAGAQLLRERKGRLGASPGRRVAPYLRPGAPAASTRGIGGPQVTHLPGKGHLLPLGT